MLRVLLFVLVVDQVWCDVDLIIGTTKGPVKGQRATDGDYTTFYGIPYSKVDEDNPFGDSLKHPYYDSKFDASDSTVKCAQFDNKLNISTGVLQCLRLNIQVPNTISQRERLPVLVWFHPGGFAHGSGGEYDGKYLVKRGIIVVTVNYRLGPYGFLCLDDATVPGNQGLKDQIQALRWVKKNIGAFGGDARSVTIAGEGSGGGAVDLHLFSKFDTYFDKAIIQSGSSFAYEMFAKADYEAAIKLAKALGHYTSNAKDAIRFLTATNPVEVTKASHNLNLQLKPCQEKKYKDVKNFVKYDPYNLYKLKRAKILIGYNSKEEFSKFASKPDEYFKSLGSLFFDLLKDTYNFEHNDVERLAQVVRSFYLGDKPIARDTMSEIVDFVSDFKINRAVELSVSKYLGHGAKNVYKYLFSYIGDSELAKTAGAGASHGDELPYLFDMKPLVTSEQELMRDRMTLMWANFVKYGDPTPESSDPVQWVPITPDSDSRPYLNIDVEMEMKDSVYKERIAFWELFDTAYWNDSMIISHNH